MRPLRTLATFLLGMSLVLLLLAGGATAFASSVEMSEAARAALGRAVMPAASIGSVALVGWALLAHACRLTPRQRRSNPTQRRQAMRAALRAGRSNS